MVYSALFFMVIMQYKLKDNLTVTVNFHKQSGVGGVSW